MDPPQPTSSLAPRLSSLPPLPLRSLLQPLSLPPRSMHSPDRRLLNNSVSSDSHRNVRLALSDRSCGADKEDGRGGAGEEMKLAATDPSSARSPVQCPSNESLPALQKQLRHWWSWLPSWPANPVKEDFFIVPTHTASRSFQWDGWGTSLCWWANFTGGLGAEDQGYILDLLFDPLKGLGLNIARYNIGGGANPAVNEYLRPFGDVPGFKPGLDAPYNWSADSRQQTVLFGARDRGANLFEAFSNSPPYWMTISGSVTGNVRWGQENLDPAYEAVFADYLTEVVKHYQEEWGIYFDYLAPFNEPIEGWWNINRRKKTAQEGCNFSVSSINRVILKLREALDKKKLKTKISAFDSWSQNTLHILQGVEEASISSIDQINVHTYISDIWREDHAKRKEVRDSVAILGQSIWMSEYGPLNWQGEEIEVALGLGKHIMLDLNELQVSAWCYWQVLETPGTLWGLLQTPFQYDIHPINIVVRKQYYVLLQFTKWIRPGFQVFPNDHFPDRLLITANPLDNTVVLVFTNVTDFNHDYSYDLSSIAPGLKGRCIQASLFRTSATENHVELPHLVFDFPTVMIRVNNKSVTTMVLSEKNI